MRSLDLQTFSGLPKLKLNFNQERKLRLSNPTMVVNIMVDMMDKVSNVQSPMRFSSMSVELLCNIQCQTNLACTKFHNDEYGTPEDMVKIIILLYQSYFGERHYCNLYPLQDTKQSLMIPYNCGLEKKPSIKHMQIWGCLAEAKPYRLHKGKLDLKTISYYFVG